MFRGKWAWHLVFQHGHNYVYCVQEMANPIDKDPNHTGKDKKKKKKKKKVNTQDTGCTTI